MATAAGETVDEEEAAVVWVERNPARGRQERASVRTAEPAFPTTLRSRAIA